MKLTISETNVTLYSCLVLVSYSDDYHGTTQTWDSEMSTDPGPQNTVLVVFETIRISRVQHYLNGFSQIWHKHTSVLQLNPSVFTPILVKVFHNKPGVWGPNGTLFPHP